MGDGFTALIWPLLGWNVDQVVLSASQTDMEQAGQRSRSEKASWVSLQPQGFLVPN